MSEGGEAVLKFLGITGDVDTSTPERLAGWVLHIAERMGLVLARQICDRHPTAQVHGSDKGDWAVMSFYTRHYYTAIARELLAKKPHGLLCRDALALVISHTRLEREQRARELQAEIAELSSAWATLAPEVAERMRARVEAQNASDFSVFEGSSMSALPGKLADTPHGRLANALVGTFYAPSQRQEAGEAIFVLALRSSIPFMKLALGA
ncbi:MAG TPA: hypothetical protein VGI81_18210 [Tepidisphaeraceae bacterium]|jgi:hypothetical protein